MSEIKTRRYESDARATTATLKPTDANGAFVALVGVGVLVLLYLIPMISKTLEHQWRVLP